MYFERSNVRSLLVVFTANFCNLSCFLLTYSTTYHFCFWFLFAPFFFGVHLVPLFAIIICFWLPFQYTIITGLFDSLHQFQLGCNFKKRGAIFPRFSIFLWYLVAYPNTYNFCFSLYLAPILFLVQIPLIWCNLLKIFAIYL